MAKVAGVSPITLSRALGCPELIGFGDLSCAAHTHPPLTTVRIDGPRIGRAIAEPALVYQPLRLDLGFEVIERGEGRRARGSR